MNTFVFAIDVRLGKNHNPFGMNGAVGDPVFLAKSSRSVDNPLVGCIVKSGSGDHFNSIVAVSQLGEAKAAHGTEIVDILEDLAVPFGAQFDHGAAKQVPLDGQLGGERAVDHAAHLVGRKYVERVLFKVEHRDEAGVGDALEPLEGNLALVAQRHVEARHEDGVAQKMLEGLSLGAVVVFQQRVQLICGKSHHQVLGEPFMSFPNFPFLNLMEYAIQYRYNH